MVIKVNPLSAVVKQSDTQSFFFQKRSPSDRAENSLKKVPTINYITLITVAVIKVDLYPIKNCPTSKQAKQGPAIVLIKRIKN